MRNILSKTVISVCPDLNPDNSPSKYRRFHSWKKYLIKKNCESLVKLNKLLEKCSRLTNWITHHK